MSPSLPPDRVTTGVPGLDLVLQGGLIGGGSFIIAGASGCGKTVLANQIAYHRCARGERAVYVTLLVESHARLLGNLASLAFFDGEAVARRIWYVSGYRALRKDGLDGLLGLCKQLVEERSARLLVLDCLNAVELATREPLPLQEFLHQLQTACAVAGCTTLIISNEPEAHDTYLSFPVVDGIVRLRHDHVGARSLRRLNLQKMRGTPSLDGDHAFEITSSGLTVYPRAEVRWTGVAEPPIEDRPRCRFGIARLDEMLGGGLPAATNTVVLGSTGSGKTLLGLTFLAEGLSRGERAVYFGFYEQPARLVREAARIGLSLARYVQNGLLTFVWQPPIEPLVDALAERLLAAVGDGVTRVVIDGLGGFGTVTAGLGDERMPRYLAALTNELRRRGVTSLLTEETRDLFSPTLTLPVEGMSLLAENLLFLHCVEIQSELERFISIIKVREGGYDTAIRRLLIGDRGIDVGEPFQGVGALLSGQSRPSGERG